MIYCTEFFLRLTPVTQVVVSWRKVFLPFLLGAIQNKNLYAGLKLGKNWPLVNLMDDDQLYKEKIMCIFGSVFQFNHFPFSLPLF